MKKFVFLLLLFVPLCHLIAQNYWESTNPSVGNVRVITARPNGDLYAGTDLGVYRSTNNGDTWTSLGLSSISVYALIFNSSGHIFAGCYNGEIYRSMDNGASWQKVKDALTTVYSLAINSQGTLFAGGWLGIYNSTNNGDTWQFFGLGNGTVVRSLIINSSGQIFAGTTNYAIYRYLSAQTGWEQVSNATGRLVESMAINSKGHIYVGLYYGGILRSTDNGTTWSAFNTGLPAVGTAGATVGSFALNASNVLFAGTLGNLYKAIDTVNYWSPWSAGLTGQSINALAVAPNGFAFAGTSGWIYRTLQSTPTPVEKEGTGIPTEFALEQNYPNPFNPSTTIRYSLPKDGNVVLSVYSILGQEVARLQDGFKKAANYSITWDGNNAFGQPTASGIYLVRLQFDNQQLMRKVMLVR